MLVMDRIIIAILFVFAVAAQSASIKVDADGFCSIAVITPVSGALGDYDEGDDSYRKLQCAPVTLDIAHPDPSLSVVSVPGEPRVEEFHVGKSPLYQLNAVWRI